MPRKLWLLASLLVPWVYIADYGPAGAALSKIVGCGSVGLFLLALRPAPCTDAVAPEPLLRLALIITSIANATAAFFQAFLSLCSGHEVCWNPSAQVWGALQQRNQFASLMALGLFAALSAASARGDTNHEVAANWLRRAVGAMTCASIMLLAFAVVASASRTGAIQVVLVTCFFILDRRVRLSARRLAKVCLFSFVIFTLLLPWLASALGFEATGLLGRADDSNAFSRIALWSNVLELIAQKPWVGHGWRSLAYAHYSTEFSGARFMELLDNAHNLPLHLAVELGLPVAIGFCGLVGWLVWRNKPWAETRADRQLAWGILMVIGIHSLLEYPLWYGPFFMTALICVGILCADVWRNWLFAQTGRAQRAIYLGVKGFAVLLLAGTAFVAFDYHRVSQIYLQPEDRSEWYKADALGAAQRSVFFQSHAKFAELQITPMTRENAPRILALSTELVKWSPEPRVIEKLIESATMMQQDDVAVFHLKRYKTAYPQAYAAWASGVR
jgi:O-antigen ligase